MHRFAYGLLAVLLAAATPVIGAQRQTPVGVWQDASNRVRVEVASCGDRLCGKIVWFRWPNDAQGLPLVDLHNPNPSLRRRPLLGLTILRGLRRTGDNTWTEGKIYNPDDGVDYQAQMSIQDDTTLRVRAYSSVPALGRTQIWRRMR
jgi:uncharacterized protein (DUF2147 family)